MLTEAIKSILDKRTRKELGKMLIELGEWIVEIVA